MKEACSHHQKMKRTGAPVSSFVCLQAVMRISHFGWEKRNMTFFLTFLTLPVARPAAQKYCPHLENRHLLHRGHPHLHPHFPRGKWENVHWKSGQTSAGATKPSSTGRDLNEKDQVFFLSFWKLGVNQISYLRRAHRSVINRCRGAFLLMNKNTFPPLSPLTGFFQGTC